MLRDARRPRTAGASTPVLLPERTLNHSAVLATHTPLHEPLHRATACEDARTNAVSTGRLGPSPMPWCGPLPLRCPGPLREVA